MSASSALEQPSENNTMRRVLAGDTHVAETAPQGEVKVKETASSGSALITTSNLPRLALFISIGTVLAFWFDVQVHDNRDLFPHGDLYPGQIMAILIGFAILSAALAFHATALVSMMMKNTMMKNTTMEEERRLLLDPSAASALNAAAEFTLLLACFFFFDRTSIVPRSKKSPNRDTFWFLWIIIMFAAVMTLRRAKPPPPPKPPMASVEEGQAPLLASPELQQQQSYHIKWLQRDQTEEWKGWMQVMFLWYHYYDAKELYNVIRLYIAAYVWMTGFGNFSYYYTRKDFSFERFCQMQWRLNFLVLWVCLLLANEYMLYYINMLHTYFTLLIYVGLGVAAHLNTSTLGISLKFAALFCFSFVMWDIRGVFDVVWWPVSWLVQYHDPYTPTRPLLHEWKFRSGLDHYIWIAGMITAFNHPTVDGLMVKVDGMGRKGTAIKLAVMGALIALACWYVNEIFMLPKKEYNALHPYTSVIPITLYILLRNLFPVFRQYHMHLFEYLGKITLETYIAQFHVWMATTGVNGAPKRLLRLLPDGWPLVNFAVVSGIFFIVSLRLFHTTNTLKAFVIPPKCTAETLQHNMITAAIFLLVLYGIALSAHTMVLRLVL